MSTLGATVLGAPGATLGDLGGSTSGAGPTAPLPPPPVVDLVDVDHPTVVAVYRALGPALTAPDPDNEWALLDLVAAIVGPLARIDDLVRARADGTPGWAALFNVAAAARTQLDWIGQWVGVQRRGGYTDEQMRALIRDRPAEQRGRPATIVAEVQALLTGSRRVELTEHLDGDAYRFRVRVYSSEAPSQAAVLAEVARHTPADTEAVIEFFPGMSWSDVAALHTWAQVRDTYESWADLRDTPPPV